MTPGRAFFFVLGLGLLGGAEADGNAQEPAMPMVPVRVRADRINPYLLDSPAVRQALKLDPSQADRKRELDALIRRELEATFHAPTSDFGPIDAVVDRWASGQMQILRPDQARRLAQIELQSRGLDVFAEPTVRDKLGLSDEQAREIGLLRAAFAEAALVQRRIAQEAIRKDSGLANRARQAAALDRIRDRAATAPLPILTEPQRRIWNDLAGEPFDFGPSPVAPAYDVPPAPALPAPSG